MKHVHIALTTAVTALGLGLFPCLTLAQQAATPGKQQAGTTWFHLQEVIARADGCQADIGVSNGKCLITFSAANGLSRAQYVALPAKDASPSKNTKPSAGEAALTQPLALLSAYVVRADGSPDPAYGSQPKDIVVLTTGDGRVIVTFTDFSADTEAGSYAYPGSISAPVSQITNAVR
jgi:hypothetical protein